MRAELVKWICGFMTLDREMRPTRRIINVVAESKQEAEEILNRRYAVNKNYPVEITLHPEGMTQYSLGIDKNETG